MLPFVKPADVRRYYEKEVIDSYDDVIRCIIENTNINKEESYDTYENRFIYSLIQNMKSYIARKKKNLEISSSLKNNKMLQYAASTEVGKEKVKINKWGPN